MTRRLLAALAAGSILTGAAPHLAMAQPATAQDVRALAADAAPAAATLDDMKPLVGLWAAEGAQMAFSAPADGQIIGHLALNAKTGPHVEELWILRPEGASVLVRQKHYTHDLAAREDKEVWGERKLVAVEGGAIYLNNLTFVRKGDHLDLILRMSGAGGATPALITYAFKRVP